MRSPISGVITLSFLLIALLKNVASLSTTLSLFRTGGLTLVSRSQQKTTNGQSSSRKSRVPTMLLDPVKQSSDLIPLTAVTASNEAVQQTVNLDSQYELSPQQFVYVVLTSIFVTCLIIADVVGVKLFEIPLPFPILGHTTVEHTCGMIIFPVTFVLGDMINEYFGPKAAKNTVYIGLAMSILVRFLSLT